MQGLILIRGFLRFPIKKTVTVNKSLKKPYIFKVVFLTYNFYKYTIIFNIYNYFYMEVEIYRHLQDEKQTSGVCVVFDKNGFPLFSSVSLERGWNNNETNISCIPIGTYKVVLEYSARFDKMLWEIKGVENRSECKFHSANYWYSLNGCVSLGLKYRDINNDGYRDVTSSSGTMKAFHESLEGHTEAVLIIKGNANIF